MKKAFILLSLSLMLASCATAYQQIATVQSSQATHSRDGTLSFSSDNVVVDYDFWSLGGEVSFVLTNKSDNDIYIDLSRSFLVVNGMTFDYFKNRTYSSTFTNVVYNPSQGKSSAYAMAKNMDNAAKNTTINGAFGKSASRGVEYVEKEGVWVPAHSSRYFPF